MEGWSRWLPKALPSPSFSEFMVYVSVNFDLNNILCPSGITLSRVSFCLLECHPHKHCLITFFLLWVWQTCTWCTKQTWVLVLNKENTLFPPSKALGVPEGLEHRKPIGHQHGRKKKGTALLSSTAVSFCLALQDLCRSVFRISFHLAKSGSCSPVSVALPSWLHSCSSEGMLCLRRGFCLTG